MTKTTLPLSVALAVSIIVNVALLRREPPAAPPGSARPSSPAGLPPPAAQDATRTPDPETDVLLLREDIRKLRNQLTVAKANRALEGYLPQPGSVDPFEQPEAREFTLLLELLESFIETRQAEGRDGAGQFVRIEKRVLTPEHRLEAIRVLEDYVALDGVPRPSFRERIRPALDAYHQVYEAYERDIVTAQKAGDNDEFFEDAQVRNQEVSDRMTRRQEQWMRDHVQPIRDLLESHNGVRASLLSHNLAGLLLQLAVPDER